MLKHIVYHKPLLESGKWQELSYVQQFGNLGSEVGRTLQAKKDNNEQRFEEAQIRMFELFDMIMDDKRWRNTGVIREICRLRELVVDYIYGENEHSSSQKFFDDYFYNFAVLANNERRLTREKNSNV